MILMFVGFEPLLSISFFLVSCLFNTSLTFAYSLTAFAGLVLAVDGACLFRRLSFTTAFYFFLPPFWSLFWGGWVLVKHQSLSDRLGVPFLFLSFSRWDLMFSTVFVWWLLVPALKKLCYGVEA